MKYKSIMRPKLSELVNGLSSRPSKQLGVGLPVAVFIITVLGAFVVNMGYLVQDNATSRSEYLESFRALLAAESGGDFGLNVLFDPADAPDYESPQCVAGPTTYSLDADPGMGGCSASVSCSASSDSGETIYTITSVGTCGTISRTIAIDAM
jgi:MSHA biogenesis protein MshP